MNEIESAVDEESQGQLVNCSLTVEDYREPFLIFGALSFLATGSLIILLVFILQHVPVQTIMLPP